ncbi:hypothetical protein [Paracoccus homiensis]|uniref:hypothetical protein n=1 Tax=Paracoccus homiensis TaxID=364199 RepID=UPI00398D1630
MWTTEAWAQDGSYQTGDLADLVQSVIGTDGTADGALGFLNEGRGSCVAYPFDTGGAAPELVINRKDGLAGTVQGSTQL